MKAVFITFNQAFYEEVIAIMDYNRIKGFTYWESVQGRGSKTGEPHYGSHAWPTINGAIMAMVREDIVDTFLESLRNLDKESEQQGLRAFVWGIEKSI